MGGRKDKDKITAGKKPREREKEKSGPTPQRQEVCGGHVSI